MVFVMKDEGIEQYEGCAQIKGLSTASAGACEQDKRRVNEPAPQANIEAF